MGKQTGLLWQIFLLYKSVKLSGIALGYRLNDRGFESREGLGIFFLQHLVQTGSGANLSSCPMDKRGSFPEGKAAGT
jgi:hypothetical protein